MCVNVDVEHACMDELMEGHDDVNACVRTYNNNITTWYLFLLFSADVIGREILRQGRERGDGESLFRCSHPGAVVIVVPAFDLNLCAHVSKVVHHVVIAKLIEFGIIGENIGHE